MSSQCIIMEQLHRQAEALADWDRLTREYPVDSAEQEETHLIHAMIEMYPHDSVVRTFCAEWFDGTLRARIAEDSKASSAIQHELLLTFNRGKLVALQRIAIQVLEKKTFSK